MFGDGQSKEASVRFAQRHMVLKGVLTFAVGVCDIHYLCKATLRDDRVGSKVRSSMLCEATQ